jgi:hypothetical protein
MRSTALCTYSGWRCRRVEQRRNCGSIFCGDRVFVGRSLGRADIVSNETARLSAVPLQGVSIRCGSAAQIPSKTY